MILSALPNERGRARILGLDCRREGGRVFAPLLLCDGGTPAGVVPARWIADKDKEEMITLTLPEMEDGVYEGEFLEVLEWQART